MLKRVGSVRLPPHAAGGYDHADVHQPSGKVYIAHTANGTVEVVDGEATKHIVTVPGCAEASGVLCAQGEGLVFAAARGAGKILVIDPDRDKTAGEVRAGSRPNGLAWDSKRGHLLAADVGDDTARLLDPSTGEGLAELSLRGRPRWSLYERRMDGFLVNIKDPPGIEVISPETFTEQRFVPVSVQGPHGLEVDGSGKAFVACDGKALVALDLTRGHELGQVLLSGEPDVLWLNADKGRIYCAIGSPGVIDVIDTEKLTPIGNVATEEGAHTLTFDAARQRMYALMPRSQVAAVYLEE